jgi:hypothetical protein
MELNGDEGRTGFEVSKGSVTVKVYPLRERQWQACWYGPRGRERKTFADRDEAAKFAKAQASQLVGRRSHVRTLSASESEDFAAAMAILGPLGVSLRTAANYFAKRHRTTVRKPIKDAVAALLTELSAHVPPRPTAPQKKRSAHGADELIDRPGADEIVDVDRAFLSDAIGAVLGLPMIRRHPIEIVDNHVTSGSEVQPDSPSDGVRHKQANLWIALKLIYEALTTHGGSVSGQKERGIAKMRGEKSRFVLKSAMMPWQFGLACLPSRRG